MDLLTLVGVAFASVEVEDGADCLSEEQVELELRAVLSDAVVDRFVTRVHLIREPRWAVQLAVAEGEEVLWTRELAVEPADCPFLPAVIARSVEQGVASLPVWRFDPVFGRGPVELGFQLYGIQSSAGTPQAGMGFAALLPVGRHLAAQAVVEIRAFGRDPLGAGTVRYLGGAISAGPTLIVPAGRHALRWSARIGAGPTRWESEGFSIRNFSGTWPRWAAVSDLGWAFPAWIRAYARVELPLRPAHFTVVESGTPVTYGEEWPRMGLVIEVSGALRRGDVPSAPRAR